MQRIKEGLSKSNILAVGGPGEHVVHYNGENAARITPFSDSAIYYYDMLMFETEAFVIGRNNTPSYGYVLHGK